MSFFKFLHKAVHTLDVDLASVLWVEHLEDRLILYLINDEFDFGLLADCVLVENVVNVSVSV